ncbi:class I SAM-dependent methyltransferase [Agarilytica rhodophyticola]|uniref:class I SAM-dependent methyltransferase n=1 Tax=Agarilytica rhodophyticola TaxID=1737490 RepID=UPI000B3436E9|nr:class I SAM-dependent methyltransferase [Agarilytica rhodophyticola]
MLVQSDHDLQQRLVPITQAIENKAALMKNLQQNCFRIFHGRGKCFHGLDWLNVDYFSSLILITIYRVPDDMDMDMLSKDIIDTLIKMSVIGHIDCGVDNVVIQRRDLYKAPFEAIYGEVPDLAYAWRQNLKFTLSFSQQNLGYFLDIEPARLWLEKKAKGKKILNLFAYTCAFSVVAIAAGASSVVNIDLSRKSLARGRDNHKVNNLSTDNVHYFAHDIFKSWGKLKKYGPYDMVIIDPPSFQKGSFIAKKDYVKVLGKMSALVADGGCFLACLNAPEIMLDEFKTWLEVCSDDFSHCQTLAHHPDFPEQESGRELKMLAYQKN